ncbi:hypothetical protein PV325_012411, partial [Microctonus aethiopoides]
MNDANEFADASFMLLTMIAVCGKLFNIIVKRKIISTMIKAVQKNLLNTQDEIEIAIISEYDRKAQMYTVIYGILSESTCTMLTLASFMYDIPQRTLPFKAWLPLNLKTPAVYWIAYIHQTIGHYIGANVNIGFDSLVAGMMMEICAQLKICKHRFNKIHQTLKQTKNYKKNEISIDEQLRLEKQLVAECTKLAELSNKTFALSIFLQYCVSSLILCVSTYGLSQMEPFSQEFISLFMYLMCMLMQIFFFCRYATEVGLQSETVCDAIYSMNWTSLNVKTKKSLVIIMIRVLNPIKYTVGHITLSLTSFSS